MEFKISKAELFTLLKEHHILRALWRAGVDNWSGYEYALENYVQIIGADMNTLQKITSHFIKMIWGQKHMTQMGN